MKKLASAMLLMGIVAFLVACGGPPPNLTVAPSPTLAQRTQPSKAQSPMIIQFCNDDTGSFPREDFLAASQLMASSLVQVVTANQQGVTLFATAITHNTFDPKNTLDPAFKVPAIPAYPTPPTPVPTHAPQDPVTDPPTATAVSQQTTSGILTYNQSVASIDQMITNAKTSVQKDAVRLTKWSPPVDNIATSILGCFQLAASRFQNQPGTKMIYIASDLENNTDVDYTQSFVTSKSLSDVIVHIIYFVSSSAGRDHEKRAQWCPFLKSAGAKAVIFSDPTVSPTLSNVFTKDQAIPALTCQ